MTLKAKVLTPWSSVHFKKQVVKEESCFIGWQRRNIPGEFKLCQQPQISQRSGCMAS